jgi:hypothetical protein
MATYYVDLPTGYYFECAEAGTTGSGTVTLPVTITENDTVTDGTVTWQIRKQYEKQVLDLQNKNLRYSLCVKCYVLVWLNTL